MPIPGLPDRARAAAFRRVAAILRDDPELRRRLGENARRLAEREFSRDQLAERALAVLERAARSRP